ncbi:uncharacterized protein PHACADRAFT_28853 [Phanerochaete carnosa HHB-10118-sp]|uniref:Uncharacterized protein n=1 Tax=Phanerochaete carnosa (strain HHB-10118-sp) TaxID=650164 RepID=K5WA64_PHACS|nr:uncharacterized protein PHACADRAFT_28853 [Phanerochaete carnosa HHB-10118-sp]EKM55849.1 hypothetical protein PHACADRAFT_28853 [Phanerochaete carnosa HHB-10118-sp]
MWPKNEQTHHHSARVQLAKVADAALSGLQEALEMAADVAGDTGVPGLQSGLTALAGILAKIKTNIDDAKSLTERIDAFKAVLKEVRQIPSDQVPRQLRDQMIDTFE